MAIKLNERTKPLINLDGPQGNALFLLGAAKYYAKQLSLDGELIMECMMSGDYGHLVHVFEYFFGNYADLETKNQNVIDMVKAVDSKQVAASVVRTKLKRNQNKSSLA